MTKFYAIGLMLILLAGCATLPTASDLYGRGPVPNKASVDRWYAEYKKVINPGYMFVAEDGSGGGFAYCEASMCAGNEMRIAQDGCLRNARGARCFIYARDGEIVWNETLPPHPRN